MQVHILPSRTNLDFSMRLFLLICSFIGAATFTMSLYNLGFVEAWWKYAVCAAFISFFVLIFMKLLKS